MNNDLISREALKKRLQENHDFFLKAWDNSIVNMSKEDKARLDEISQCIAEVVNAPTVLHDNYCMGYQDGVRKVLSERPQGKWIVKSNGTTNYYACDKCGSAGDIQDKFCRECGADMRKGRGNENQG